MGKQKLWVWRREQRIFLKKHAARTFSFTSRKIRCFKRKSHCKDSYFPTKYTIFTMQIIALVKCKTNTSTNTSTTSSLIKKQQQQQIAENAISPTSNIKRKWGNMVICIHGNKSLCTLFPSSLWVICSYENKRLGTLFPSPLQEYRERRQANASLNLYNYSIFFF